MEKKDTAKPDEQEGGNQQTGSGDHKPDKEEPIKPADLSTKPEDEEASDHDKEVQDKEQPRKQTELSTQHLKHNDQQEPETIASTSQSDEEDEVDACEEQSQGNEDAQSTNTGAGGAKPEEHEGGNQQSVSGDYKPDQEEPIKPADLPTQHQKHDDQQEPETIASTSQSDKENEEEVNRCEEQSQGNEDTRSTNTGAGGGGLRYLIAGCVVVVVVAILVQHLLHPEPPPQKNFERQVDIFLRQMEKVKTQFPNQRTELWKRSKIHLERHLKTAQPTEPVSLILTASRRSERTLQCLARGLASSFSSALNASVLHIDGASKASQDSDQVKLDIDSKLRGAFEGDKPVAVIHRLEELPPGSTLIFYRYCDHENAAYKNILLVFTVLLEEEEIPAKIHLSAVEEMVDDHLKKKFLSHEHPVSFDRMDLDKYGGLWSRISHLILPVAAEERIEHKGCPGT